VSEVAPPAGALWDVDDIAQRALAVLRLGPGDVDETRVQDAVVAATARIDSMLDQPEPVTPTGPMTDSAVQVTVGLYRRKDAPLGVTDAWSADTVALTVPGSPLAGVRAELLPDKARWGVS
jgi:hypothetical protein